MTWTDRVAVVTGAASGIGAATAREFAVEGATTCLLDINEDAVQSQAATLRDEGYRATAYHVDVSDAGACRSVAGAIAAETRRIDALVNDAASFLARGLDATTEDWETILGVNVRGYANMVQACHRHMPSGSAIVNLCSISAHIAQPKRWTYNASKGAILTMTKCMALDLSADGIRVNAVSPGWIWTPEVDRAAGGDRAHWEPVWGPFHLLRRVGEAREVARAILFLCSDDASFITGAELPVDGGYLAMSAEGLGASSAFAGSA